MHIYFLSVYRFIDLSLNVSLILSVYLFVAVNKLFVFLPKSFMQIALEVTRACKYVNAPRQKPADGYRNELQRS